MSRVYWKQLVIYFIVMRLGLFLGWWVVLGAWAGGAKPERLADNCLTGYWFVVAGGDALAKNKLNDGVVLSIAMPMLRAKLRELGAHVLKRDGKKRGRSFKRAEVSISKQASKDRAFRRTHENKRYRLQLQASHESESLKLEMLVMTFPRQSLKASFSVRAKSKSVAIAKVLEKMVQRLLEDAMDEIKLFG